MKKMIRKHVNTLLALALGALVLTEGAQISDSIIPDLDDIEIETTEDGCEPCIEFPIPTYGNPDPDC